MAEQKKKTTTSRSIEALPPFVTRSTFSSFGCISFRRVVSREAGGSLCANRLPSIIARVYRAIYLFRYPRRKRDFSGKQVNNISPRVPIFILFCDGYFRDTHLSRSLWNMAVRASQQRPPSCCRPFFLPSEHKRAIHQEDNV